MPVYEFRCQNCRKYVALTFSYSDYDTAEKRCIHCESDALTRLISRVAVAKSEEARMARVSDPSLFADVNENDPKSIGRMMRRMNDEMGGELGAEYGQVVERLESGESTASIESDMPTLGSESATLK